MTVEPYSQRIISVESHNIKNVVKETNNQIIDHTEESNEEREKDFRERYSQELRSKRQQINDKHRGYNELEDERKRVRQQMMRTPGRRGEIIKEEEIYKEFGRRYSEN